MKVESAARPGRVVAEYACMEQARAAIEALQFAGIEASDIALAGTGADEARRLADAGGVSRGERRMLGRVLWLGFWWSAVGAVAGIALGALFGATGWLFPGTSMALQVACWGMFLHIAGALWGAYAGLSMGGAWELSYQQVSGPVTLAVTARTASGRARVERIARDKQAVRVFAAE